MVLMNKKNRKPIVDSFASSAQPSVDNSDLTSRGTLWWIFVMPGKVILWIAYMFPERFGSIFGSARRRNVPLLQVVYSLGFYFAILVLALFLIPNIGK